MEISQTAMTTYGFVIEKTPGGNHFHWLIISQEVAADSESQKDSTPSWRKHSTGTSLARTAVFG